MLAGGESGPPVVPGEAERSLLMQALRHEGDLEMPPEETLPQPVVDDFARWIAMGTADPRDSDPAPAGGDFAANENAKGFQQGDLWSFEAILSPEVPDVVKTDWPQDALDFFVLSAMGHGSPQVAAEF